MVASTLKRAGRRVMQVPSLAGAARRAAARRGHGLVLIYHRVSRRQDDAAALVPTVGPDQLVRQIEILGEMGRIVPLSDLLEAAVTDGSPRFALTFDDDYTTHAEWVLPVLQRLNVPGTFFLSGRSLHGKGPYWFESLEGLIARRGVGEAQALLGMPGAGPEALALACENDPVRQRIVEGTQASAAEHLTPRQIEDLARAGMSIGFHTVDHTALPALSDEDVRSALERGREELARLVGRPVVLFAYPHGKADRRTADKVRESGFAAAWTGRPGPIRPRDHRYLLNRWEPGPVGADRFVTDVTIRLHRTGSP
jgi:peptidoglycan/xylan/chitin deacetylase (PgdA/CDA1 family)